METGPTASARQLLLRDLLRLDAASGSAFERLVDGVDRATGDGTLVSVARELVLGPDGRDVFLAALAEGRELDCCALLRELTEGRMASSEVEPHSTPAAGLAVAQAGAESRRTNRHVIVGAGETMAIVSFAALGWFAGRQGWRPIELAALVLALVATSTLRFALTYDVAGRTRAVAEMVAVLAACAAAVMLAAGLLDAKLASTWIALSDAASIGSAACSLYTLSRLR